MRYKIVYDSPGRIRLRCGKRAFKRECESALISYITSVDGVDSAEVSYVNGGILIYYSHGAKQKIFDAICSLDTSCLHGGELTQAQITDDEFKKDLKKIVIKSLAMKMLLPSFLRVPLTIKRAVPFVKEGISSLSKGKIGVNVLDAVSITSSILSGSPSTASSVMTLLNISSLLENYTRKKAKNALSNSLSFNIDKVWKIQDEGAELIPLANVCKGDVIRIQQGSMIPVDGTVVFGSAEVNEASMTGESIPVEKSDGNSVYAGTVVENGSIDIEVVKLSADSRIHNIIEMIENSEDLKSGVQTKAEKFADSLVPFSFITSVVTYALTRNFSKALSALMVDYSCAIKLSTPICVISAMKEATNYDIMIKGGRFLENYAFADTVVFDKTGTLTVSCPTLAKILSFENYSDDEILKTAACLEEHFPHSVAKAIVSAAQQKGIEHKELHADVKYIVAHGIASDIDGKRALIGSAHFIFDDEKVPLTEEQENVIKAAGNKYSMVYLAIGGKLCGVLCIEDPVRKNAKDVISKLKVKGFKDILMITGDGESTASAVCKELGIDSFHARVLPEDKLNIIKSIQSSGHKVVMVGDGINDSPALAAADVSVAMKDASDIARETADITLLSSDLERLVVLRNLSEELFDRIHSNYKFITLFNSVLLICGVTGLIAPVSGAMLHNLSTMGICAKSMKPYLNE